MVKRIPVGDPKEKMEAKTTSMIDPIILCSECQAGHMHRAYVAYYTWLGNEMITVPDFPAWVCDICGRCEYDENALARLSLLLSPNAGKTIATARKIAKKDRTKPKMQHSASTE